MGCLLVSCEDSHSFDSNEPLIESKSDELYTSKPKRRTDFTSDPRVKQRVETFKEVLKGQKTNRSSSAEYSPAEFSEIMTENLNYEFADFSSAYDVMDTRKDTIDVQLDGNGKISGAELDYLNDMCIYLVSDHYYQISESNKSLLSAHVKSIQDNGSTYLAITSTIGIIPPNYPPFSEGDWYTYERFAPNMKCNNTGSSNIWVGHIFESELSQFYNIPTTAHYVTDIITENIDAFIYGPFNLPSSDPNPSLWAVTDYFYPALYSLPWAVGGSGQTDAYCESLVDLRQHCGSPDDLNHYFNNYVLGIDLLRPSNLDFVSIDIEQDYILNGGFFVPGSNENCKVTTVAWTAEVTYGIIHTDGLGDVLPFFENQPMR